MILTFSNAAHSVTALRSEQKGSSMLEVLVAILLVSVGLLGIAGLSGATLSYNKASQLRLTGMALVNDYADRARINVYGYDRDQYSIALADAAPAAITPDPNLDTSVPANAGVAADNLAQFDRREFLNNVRDRLPSGEAVVVSRRSAATRDMDIWLLWKEPEADSGDALFTAGQTNCPSDLSAGDKKVYSCMYFKVGL